MKKTIVSILTFMLFSIFLMPLAFADVVKNNRLVRFSIEGELDTKCTSRPKFKNFSNESTGSKIKMAILCNSRGVKGSDQPWANIIYFTAQRQQEVIDVWLGMFSKGEEGMYPYKVVKGDEFFQYDGLILKEVELAPGKNIRLPYEEIAIRSGEIAEVYYMTLYINNRVYRHHALVRIATGSGSSVLWIAFMNQKFTTYKGINSGQNDPVMGTVRSVLPEIQLTQ